MAEKRKGDNRLLFGTGGTPRSARSRDSLAGIQRIKELGLDCLELEFVQGVKMGKETALRVGKLAGESGIRLSAHAPYFINLNAREKEKLAASRERILQTARVAKICGASSAVFHAAFYLGDPPEKIYPQIKTHLSELRSELDKEGNSVKLRPELTGKGTQFGSLEEILKLSREIKGVLPCIDFAHYYARENGRINSYQDFAAALEKVKENLGKEGLKDMHIHMSGIEYGAKGEKKHLNLAQSKINYRELLQALKDFEAEGTVICESPNLEKDALLLQKTYQEL
jgi:deoxyribonuclease-4